MKRCKVISENVTKAMQIAKDNRVWGSGNVESDDELMQKLQFDKDFNPWLKVSGFWQKSDRDSYYLEDDANRIRHYHELSGSEENKNKMKLHLDLLPQPFVGTPEAGIWLMLKNPGYSEWDEYDDHGDFRGKKEELREWKSDEEEKQMLLKRRELTLKQFKFALQGEERFYVLNDAFRTKRDGVGRCEGAFRWYQMHLSPENNSLIRSIDPSIEPSQYSDWCSRNLFVLDYFPYHSERFYDEGADCLKQQYWSNLVKHGLSNKKLMVFWGSRILNRVKRDYPEAYEESAKEGRIAILRGSRAMFSDRNFVFATDRCGTRIKEFVK